MEKTTPKKLISAKIDENIESLIIQYAKQRKWKKSFAVNEILTQFFYELARD